MNKLKKIKECSGCVCFTQYNFKNVTYTECGITSANIVDMPNCICKDCLLKCVCDNICEDFLNQLKEYNSEVIMRSVKIGGSKKYL